MRERRMLKLARGTLAQEAVVLPRDCFSSCMYSSSRSSGRLMPCAAPLSRQCGPEFGLLDPSTPSAAACLMLLLAQILLRLKVWPLS